MLTQSEQQLFEEYCTNHFVTYSSAAAEDLSFLDFWNAFIFMLKERGAEKAINTMLVPKLPVCLKHGDSISAEIYDCEAGKIPVITIRDTTDFENLVTNLVHKGKRPENLSSTGASFVFGKKTRFIILSQKPYSNVSAKTLGLTEDDWLEKSMQIRLEHECTHFFTKKYFGTAQNHLHDELVADFFGIMKAFGFYKAEYFEYFMGIRGTEGSRLLCYIPDCSKNLFEVLKETAVKAAAFLEDISQKEDFKKLSHKEKICFLCKTDLLKSGNL